MNMQPYHTSEELLRLMMPKLQETSSNVMDLLTNSIYTLLFRTPVVAEESCVNLNRIEDLQRILEEEYDLHFFLFRDRAMAFYRYHSTDWQMVREETIELETELERHFSSLRDKSGMTMKVSIGRPFQGLLHLQDAYSELINSTMSFSIRPGRLVISEYDIVSDPSLLGEPYPQTEIERRLVDNILNLEFKKAHNVMNEIICYERSSLRLNLSFLPRMSKRVEWILIVLHVPRNSGDAKGAEIYSYPYRIQYAEGNNAGEALVHEFFEKLEDYYQAFRFNVGKDISQITGFIQEHYADINLDATMICDRFRISPSYLSHMFKKRTGIRLIDYIHGVRVAKARELLSGTDMAIRDIGTAVGYISNASFSTTFKRYESITPSQFRETARANMK